MQTREYLNLILKEQGVEALQIMLEEKDPDYSKKVDLNNSRRLIRALEVCIDSGKPYSSFLGKQNKIRSFTPVLIGLKLSREELYRQINLRCDKMLESGLLEEVKSLYNFQNYPALNTIGYSEFFEFLNGKITIQTAIEIFKQHSRNYAKRQLTWWRKQNDIFWFDATDTKKAFEFILNAL